MALRVVSPGEKPPAPLKPKSIVQAAEEGSRLELLRALRLRLARAVQDPECPPRDLAALTRRLDDLAKQVEGLELAAQQEDRERVDVDDEDWSAEAL